MYWQSDTQSRMKRAMNSGCSQWYPKSDPDWCIHSQRVNMGTGPALIVMRTAMKLMYIVEWIRKRICGMAINAVQLLSAARKLEPTWYRGGFTVGTCHVEGVGGLPIRVVD